MIVPVKKLYLGLYAAEATNAGVLRREGPAVGDSRHEGPAVGDSCHEGPATEVAPTITKPACAGWNRPAARAPLACAGRLC